jgi:spermidine/putrescine ABC transporter ATP-binding subunit
VEQSRQLRLDGVTKYYGTVMAVDDLYLNVAEGEFITLLGPSGCGKTTTLRMIAGLEEPTVGSIWLGSEDITRVPAFKRPTNMVFQSYALFPHLVVYENIVFGLKNLKVPKAEQKERADAILGLVRLEGLQDRRPNELSGGQQQRVALARALVNEPAVLLLDEPLGALDAKLRKAMRFELKRIQRELGVSFIYVTHDQEEAISLSDRIVLMDEGRVQQEDTPRAIFEDPRNEFVADFVGVGNFLPGECVETSNGTTSIRWGDGAVAHVQSDESVPVGAKATVWIRAADVMVGQSLQGTTGEVFTGKVGELLYYGDYVDLVVVVGGNQEIRTIVTATEFYREQIEIGKDLEVGWEPEKARLFTG